MLTLFIGFILGALTVISLQVLGVLFLLRRLNRRLAEKEAKSAPLSGEVCADNLDIFNPSKQGIVWILEVEKIPKTWLTDNKSREQKRKKEIFEVNPARKFAKIRDQSLILRESDGSLKEIRLSGCRVEAVSATSFSSRKWAKRYPIKVESKTSVIYHGSRTLHIYLDTSWEKESWCKALRLASCDNREKLKGFAKLRLEFQSYLASLNIGSPAFMKPSMGFTATTDKSVQLDGSSKVRHFLKKLAKKATKSGTDNKASWASTSDREERKIIGKSGSLCDSVSSTTGLLRPVLNEKAPTYTVEANSVPSSLSSTHSGSRSNLSVVSDVDSDDQSFSDEGILFWNLLISRLFFDVKRNSDIRRTMQARIQRTLANMRTPSYIGEVTCIDIDPGNLPPYLQGMRVLPSDMNEVLALEIDVEYSGGVVLDIETRVEVHELDFQEGFGKKLESSSVQEVSSDLLEGFEYFEEQLKHSDIPADEVEKKDGDSKLVEIKSYKRQGSSHVSRWKSIANSIAKQVSQVPLSLSIRVASLRGTLRLHIKPPPSDQLWFGFTSMPDIDFNLESSVGDHKITSSRVALLLISRFKAAIRDTLVLPNCDSICIPWMLAEKDDWVERKAAPFIWSNQVAVNEIPTVSEVSTSEYGAVTPVSEASSVSGKSSSGGKYDEANKLGVSIQQQASQPTLTRVSSLDPMAVSTSTENSLQELKTPLLGNDEEPQETCLDSKEEKPECQPNNPVCERTISRFQNFKEQENHTVDGDDGRPKGTGTRARMLSLRKKMGEKLEEKRRTIEERGRNMVERMRRTEDA